MVGTVMNQRPALIKTDSGVLDRLRLNTVAHAAVKEVLLGKHVVD
jgi:hypothetical protein